MKSAVELAIELIGALILLFAAVSVFVRLSGYGEHYDKKIYDEESDADITIQQNNTDNKETNDDIIHHVSI